MRNKLPRPAVLQRFGRLRVIIPEGRRINRTRKGPGDRSVLCICDCGNLTAVPTRKLYSGNTSSCGCIHREQLAKRNTRHGMSTKPEYNVWNGMKSRCYSPNDAEWHNYGGRGIKVCDRWLHDFAAFYADMGPRPSAKHSIERVDVDGDYCPENCCWATPKEQARNRRNNRWVVYQGQRMTQADAAAASGVPLTTIWSRLARGCSAEELFAPPRPTGRQPGCQQLPLRLVI
jgi:hypothetical protein